MERIFFVDFDGTITLEDSCFLMVKHFSRSGWEEVNELWEKGELGTVECANRTFQLFDGNMTEMVQFLKQIPIDPYFKEFINITRTMGDKLYILSDGYDINIKTILAENDIDDVLFYCNKLLYSEGVFQIGCPYYNNHCGKCGNCKTTLLKRLRKKGAQIVYIGDGTSDQCPVKYADIVFAKKGLLTYCQENDIYAKEYESFKDILDWLK